VEAENLATVDVTRVFTPDAVLPIQVTYQPAARWLQRLYLAVFDDALRCLGVRGVHGGPRARARHKQEAWNWVLSDADYCFSFTAVCSVLNLDAGSVRRQLRQCFEGSARQAGVSRQLRQPLSRAPSVRVRARRWT
jgi:hypothetical protein